MRLLKISLVSLASLFGTFSSLQSRPQLSSSLECPIAYPIDQNRFSADSLESLISVSYAAYHNGLMYHQVDNNPCSLFYYKQAVEFRPNFPEAYNNLGLVYESIGYIHGALESHLQW